MTVLAQSEQQRQDADPEFFKQQSQILVLERQLTSYLSSWSWRGTEWFRSLSGLLPGSDLGADYDYAAARATLSVQDYIQYLKKTVRQIRRSRAWKWTKPLRTLQSWLPVATKMKGRPGGFDFQSRAQSRERQPGAEHDSGRQSGLVSVIVPTWNRASTLPRALSSVQSQTYGKWQCWIIDDGSTDDTKSVVRPYLADPRFKYVPIAHAGVSQARNVGLNRAGGDIIAYLDSDNMWLGDYLAEIVRAYRLSSDVNAIYTAQLVQESKDSHQFSVRCHPWDADALRVGNYIDLNAFSHRRLLIEKYGGFDENLSRLVDWDLILRYTASERVACLPVLGSLYFVHSPARISSTQSHDRNRAVIEEKCWKMPGRPLRVLYALWHYPQLTESYVETEMQAVRKLGVDVRVWSEETVAAPYESTVPVYRGNLRDAIIATSPDVIHCHWLHMAQRFASMIEDMNIPITTKAHGFEFSPELAAALENLKAIQKVYLYAHQLQGLSFTSSKAVHSSAAFNADFYYPHARKDRSLVLRVSAGLASKDLTMFMHTARLCPQHRFVLVVGHCYQVEPVVDEIVEQNRQLGSPVEILVDLQYAEVSALMRQAGIYMHTLGEREPFGMPISIAESMATGALVLLRDRPESRLYGGDAAHYYRDADGAAAVIRETMTWDEQAWSANFAKTVGRAHSHFHSLDVYANLVSDWNRLRASKLAADAEAAETVLGKPVAQAVQVGCD